MILINNTESRIFISDIGVVVPHISKGSVTVSDSRAADSKDLLSLISANKIKAIVDSTDIKIVKIDGHSKHVIPGEVIWTGNGKTRAFCKIDLEQEDAKSLLISLKRPVKKYKIKKNISSNLSLDSACVVLTNKNPIIIMDDFPFQSRDVQKCLANGMIELIEIMEEYYDSTGKVAFRPFVQDNIKKDDVQFVRPTNTEFSNLECCWEGPIFDSGGYANMNRSYVSHLTRLGVKVKPSLVNTQSDIEDSIVKEITRLSSNDVNRRCSKIYATNVPGKHTGPVVAYTMMETESIIHPDLVKMLAPASEIWVPSEWNRQVFSNSGLNNNVKVMPLGINNELYCPRESKIVYSFPIKKFIFYACSTWIWRKGWDVLLKAYAKAFSSDDDVSLVIFSRSPFVEASRTVNAVRTEIESFVPNRSDLPHLAFITGGSLPASIMPYMYNSIDAFVLFSRGEGWGLPYCEAAASGIPVIGADHGGQQMFLNDENSFLVKPDKIAQCHRSLLPMSPFYKGMRFADYSTRAINQAADLMRRVYEDKKEAQERAEKCMNNVVSNFTWRKSALNVAKRLREIRSTTTP